MGAPRRRQLVRECSICGRPITPGNAHRGRCSTCYSHWRKYGVDRLEASWNPTPEIPRCDCGQPATHFGVPVFIWPPNGHRALVTFDLCECCYQLEIEPVLTKGEAVWNR